MLSDLFQTHRRYTQRSYSTGYIGRGDTLSACQGTQWIISFSYVHFCMVFISTKWCFCKNTRLQPLLLIIISQHILRIRAWMNWNVKAAWRLYLDCLLQKRLLYPLLICLLTSSKHLQPQYWSCRLMVLCLPRWRMSTTCAMSMTGNVQINLFLNINTARFVSQSRFLRSFFYSPK